jgi:hypothetical protein
VFVLLKKFAFMGYLRGRPGRNLLPG